MSDDEDYSFDNDDFELGSPANKEAEAAAAAAEARLKSRDFAKDLSDDGYSSPENDEDEEDKYDDEEDYEEEQNATNENNQNGALELVTSRVPQEDLLVGVRKPRVKNRPIIVDKGNAAYRKARTHKEQLARLGYTYGLKAKLQSDHSEGPVPSQDVALLNSALMYRVLGDDRSSEKVLRRAIKLFPSDKIFVELLKINLARKSGAGMPTRATPYSAGGRSASSISGFSNQMQNSNRNGVHTSASVSRNGPVPPQCEQRSKTAISRNRAHPPRPASRAFGDEVNMERLERDRCVSRMDDCYERPETRNHTERTASSMGFRGRSFLPARTGGQEQGLPGSSSRAQTSMGHTQGGSFLSRLGAGSPAASVSSAIPPCADLVEHCTTRATPSNPTVVFAVGPIGSGKKTQSRFVANHAALDFTALHMEVLLRQQHQHDLDRPYEKQVSLSTTHYYVKVLLNAIVKHTNQGKSLFFVTGFPTSKKMWKVWNDFLTPPAKEQELSSQSVKQAKQKGKKERVEPTYHHLNIDIGAILMYKISKDKAIQRAVAKANIPSRDKTAIKRIQEKVSTNLLNFRTMNMEVLSQIKDLELKIINADGSFQDVFDQVFEVLYSFQPPPEPTPPPDTGRTVLLVSIMGPPGVGKSTHAQLLGKSNLKCTTELLPELEDVPLNKLKPQQTAQLQQIAAQLVATATGDKNSDILVVDNLPRSKVEWTILQRAIQSHAARQVELPPEEQTHIMWYGVLLSCAKDECKERIEHSQEETDIRFSEYEKQAFDFHFNFDKGEMGSITTTISTKSDPQDVQSQIVSAVSEWAREHCRNLRLG
mmetsp:Transcript_35790/g.70270  ORF Transcript_35790/g.70270 Transcript_35790/m.70270 type:complete len:821 (-) Transcript_35790:192-2654(-)|eukprot:CAMPEP_0175142512 /NCGR_PEP_ID=MMETSP0087-20121206/12856_1 /TAXON_ID=136419 /ORGANISM="Unknown Unknown, Strain D1" /LENGTH=820 /DNA_ID=CAMNT_0016426355 /DNA_START=45 /DNA_END=2507 /DNA_ORIENTATION=+